MSRPPSMRPARALVDLIVTEEAAHAGITPDALLGSSRLRIVSWARWRACKRLRELGYSLPVIGAALGGKDHTSVLHALRKNTDDIPRLKFPRRSKEPKPAETPIPKHKRKMPRVTWIVRDTPQPRPAVIVSEPPIIVPKHLLMGHGREYTRRWGGPVSTEPSGKRPA